MFQFPGGLIPVVLFIVVGYVIKVISDNSVKRALINKSQINENIKFLYSNSKRNDAITSIKWGIVLIAIGIALLIGVLSDFEEGVIFGLVFLLAGIGLLLFYFITGKKPESEIQTPPSTQDESML